MDPQLGSMADGDLSMHDPFQPLAISIVSPQVHYARLGRSM